MIKETIDNTKVITSSEDYKAKLWSIQWNKNLFYYNSS